MREEIRVDGGCGVPVLDCGSGGGCCVWDSIVVLVFGVIYTYIEGGCFKRKGRDLRNRTGHPGNKSHLHG